MNKNAFTLVEMIVGITISILLMTSIWVFVSSGMNNITLQKKVLDDNKEFSHDMLYLQKKIGSAIQYISNIWSYTGILLKQNVYFDEWWWTYISVKQLDKQFCGTWEITKTNHIVIHNFIPLAWVSTWTTIYKSDIKSHQIMKKSDNSVVVWRDIYGDKFSEWDLWTDVFLNSPTWIVEIDWKLVFSDTLNDRILYLSGSRVYSLVDEKDWLKQPIWLAYNSWEKALYIANAGKWEILKLSSLQLSSNPDLVIEIFSQSSITKLKIEINTGEIFTTSTDLSDYTFLNNSNNTNDFVSLENNKIHYYFIGNYNSANSQSDCDWTNNWKIVNSSDEVIYCISSGTGKLATLKPTTLTNETITIKNLTPVLIENKNYYTKVNNKYFPYFTQWDNDIFTQWDNVLEVLQSGLLYPMWVNSIWTVTDFDPTSFDFNSLTSDHIIKNPIKNLEKKYSSNLLNIKLNYYKYLNCFNPDEKVEKTYLFKKNF